MRSTPSVTSRIREEQPGRGNSLSQDQQGHCGPGMDTWTVPGTIQALAGSGFGAEYLALPGRAGRKERTSWALLGLNTEQD